MVKIKIKIKSIHCESEEVVKMEYQKNGTPRFGCKDCGKTFQVYYVNNGAKPGTKNDRQNVN